MPKAPQPGQKWSLKSNSSKIATILWVDREYLASGKVVYVYLSMPWTKSKHRGKCREYFEQYYEYRSEETDN